MYPLNLNLRGRPVLVAGGGRVAERKILGLLEAGADRLRVVSPELAPKLAELAAAGRIEWLARPFAPEDAAGCLLVQEAGGLCTRLDGSPLPFDGGKSTVLAGGPWAWADFRALPTAGAAG